MSIVYQDHDNIVSGGTFIYNTAANYIAAAFVAQSSNSASRTFSSCTLTDGTNSTTLAQKDYYELAATSTRQLVILGGLPHASWTNGATITVTLAWTGGTMTAAGQGTVVQMTASTPGTVAFEPTSGTAHKVTQATTATPWADITMTSRNNSALLGISFHTGGTGTFATPAGFLERRDDTLSPGTGEVQTYTKDVTTGGTETVTTTPSAARIGLAMFGGFYESAIDLTSVNGGSAMTEGQAAVALVGSSMNAAGADIKLRITTATSTFQTSGGTYSASSGTAATFTVPTLTSLPFSQNAAGTGLTTWNLEAIGTATAGDDVSAVAIEIRPQSGWDVVEIATPDLTSASLLFYLGWTAVATDLIQWQSSVVVDTVTVTITVNDDGTFQYTSVYTSGGAAAPLPSFTWNYKAWDSASKLWTSAATVTAGGSGGINVAGKVGRSILDLMRRRRH